MTTQPNQHLQHRLQLYRKAHANPELQTLLMERCRRDVVFWFNNFAWTFDPRKKSPHLPFVLYPYQEKLLLQLLKQIENGEDVLLEKSRDMGVSWLIVLLFQYLWLFKSGANFHLGSRKSDYVDKKGDPSTLFQKIRYNLYRLPTWMRPKGYTPRHHDHEFKLMNPEQGNVITGESSNDNFARGGRYLAILFDEFPFWMNAEAAFASSGQSTPCRMVVGTPYGKQNTFARLRFHSDITVLRTHWQAHPEKDDAWYRAQIKRMTDDEIARELDINYTLSIKSLVFPEFGKTHQVPLKPMEGKRIVRSWDFGYHCPACLFLQKDDNGRLQVLKEVVGFQEQIDTFANRVLEETKTHFSDAIEAKAIEDICDPAGAQRSDKSTLTSIEILNKLGVYPFYGRSRILDGLQLIRYLLKPLEDDSNEPALLIDPSCQLLIDAFEGGYRYPTQRKGQQASGDVLPIEEHPYEDVMDCLRYGVVHYWGSPNTIRRPSTQRTGRINRYTGY